MEPVQWAFVIVAAWMVLLGITLFINYRFHEWQNDKMKRLRHPQYGGRVRSEE